jgi:hypothetical protein
MARYSSAADILNRVAVEVGILKTPDPYSSTDESFIQLQGLLDSAGQEMVELYAWQTLVEKFNLTTKEFDTGTYDLPDDFSYMIDQTGWDRTNRVAIGGPLSAQDWAYLEGRDLVSQSIYASFRLVDNKFDLYPQPPPIGLEISFEYISRNWVLAEDESTRADVVTGGGEFVLYEPILIIKFLKCKFLEAKGFDPSSARLEFDTMFMSRTGKDKGASILSASNNSRGFPYLHPYYNTGDTGYGGGVP